MSEVISMADAPSVVLQRAADELLRLAAHFEDYEQSAREEPARVGSPQSWWAYDVLDRLGPAQGKRWVETLSPAAAAPLAAWLHEESLDASCARSYYWSEYEARPSMAFARMVLGLQPSEKQV